MKTRVLACWFTEGAVEIQFVAEDDVRDEGLVSQQHVVNIVRSPQYAEEIETLEAAAHDLLTDVLEDWPNKKIYTGEEPVDEDEDRGMGDG